MEQFIQYINDFSYPTAIVAAYVVITLTKRYTNIESKYFLLIAIITGILVVISEEMFINPITLKKLITGALSGVIATLGYETINKIVRNKTKGG